MSRYTKRAYLWAMSWKMTKKKIGPKRVKLSEADEDMIGKVLERSNC